MTADDSEICGEELAPILRKPGSQAVVEALAGCRFYRDDPDDLAEIVRCEPGPGRLTIRTAQGTPRVVALVAGYVLVTPALRSALDAAITPEDRAEQSLRADIAAFGFATQVEQRDLADLHEAVQSGRKGRVPLRDERQRFLDLAAKYGDDRTVARMAGAWIDAEGAGFMPDALIALITALRHSGRTADAAVRSDVLLEHGLPMSPQERSILFTERAAVMADRFEQTGEWHFFDEARRCAGCSWAIDQSP